MVTELNLDAEMHSRKERHTSYNGTISTSMIGAWFEVWDYVGGASFRGFVAGEGSERCLFTFFDAAVVGKDLKQGYVLLDSIALPIDHANVQADSWHSSNLQLLPLNANSLLYVSIVILKNWRAKH